MLQSTMYAAVIMSVSRLSQSVSKQLNMLLVFSLTSFYVADYII